mgnify:CR=1 FL=1
MILVHPSNLAHSPSQPVGAADTFVTNFSNIKHLSSKITILRRKENLGRVRGESGQGEGRKGKGAGEKRSAA